MPMPWENCAKKKISPKKVRQHKIKPFITKLKTKKSLISSLCFAYNIFSNVRGIYLKNNKSPQEISTKKKIRTRL